MGRSLGIALLVILWVICAGLLLALGGGGWTTRAMLLAGLMAGVAAFLMPR